MNKTEKMVLSSVNTEIQNPLNFKVVDGRFTADEVLNAYFKGKESVMKELKELIKSGLQLSSVSSNYLFEKLKNEAIKVEGMYLRFVTPKEFDTLVIISDEDYYNKEKRWNAYKYAREINKSIDDLSLNFSFIPHSDEIDNSIIASDGFVFKYDKK
jgi:tRNA splicing endonuclease